MADKREYGTPKHGPHVCHFGNLVKAPRKTENGYVGTIVGDGFESFDAHLRDELVERLGNEPTKKRLLFMGRLVLTPVTVTSSNGTVREFLNRELDGEVGPDDMDATYVVSSGTMVSAELLDEKKNTARGYLGVTPWTNKEVPMKFSIIGRFGRQVAYLQNRRHVLVGGFLKVKEDKGKLFYNIMLAKVQFSSFVQAAAGKVSRSPGAPASRPAPALEASEPSDKITFV